MSLTDKISNVASWCKSKFLYYLVYTPQDRALIDRVERARKSGEFEQFKPIQKYSEKYWNMRAVWSKYEDLRD